MHAKILITGGGSGGHVYPALSIVRCLRRSAGRQPGALESGYASKTNRSQAGAESFSFIYIGNRRGLERDLVPRAGIPAYLFPMYPPGSLRGIVSLATATLRSLLILLRSRPRVTFATGGYVSVPAAVASWLFRVPLVVYLPDVVPGKAVSWLVPFANRIAVTAADSLRYLPNEKTVVTGYPVRESFLEATRRSGRTLFGIPDDATVLCVFGGSLGARSLNEALAACLPAVLRRAHVIHVCGQQRLEEATAAATLPADLRSRYLLVPYLHDSEMAEALAAADLAVARSGASVLGEMPATETPSVLVPLPDPAVHQRENAEYLAQNGAAVVLANQDLGQLPALLDALLGDPARLARMAAAARTLSRPDAAAAIAQLIEETA